MLFRISNFIAFVALTASFVSAHEEHHEIEHKHKAIPKPEAHHPRSWQPNDINSGFQSCQSQVSNYGPSFEQACQNSKPEVLVNGLVQIRTTIVALSAQVHAGISVWVSADLNAFANLYVGLLAKIQVLLEIIHSHNQIDSCRDSIVGLNVPLNALLSVFVNAGIDVNALLGVNVNLNLLVSLGLSLNLSLNLNIGL